MKKVRRKEWQALAIGIVGMYILIFVVIPTITRHEATAPIYDLVRAKDMDTGVLFYTESEEAAAAEYTLRKTAATNHLNPPKDSIPRK